jgi:phage terminase large subunit
MEAAYLDLAIQEKKRRLRDAARCPWIRSVKDPRALIPEKFWPLLEPHPVKVLRGGRGSAKSWTVARLMVASMLQRHERVMCTREYQSSVRDSVHQVLKRQTQHLDVTAEYVITDKEIRCPRTDSEFFFKGLRYHPEEIKSAEGITKTWVEEGQSITQDSLDILLPTVFRDDRSELWITYNPDEERAPIERFLADPPPGTIVVDVSWRDNPYFPAGMERLRAHAETQANATGDWDAYNWIWEGQFRKVSEAIVFWRRVVVEEFDPPLGVRWYHGADWGFANDPTVLVRMFVTDENDGKHLWIDKEAVGYRTDIDELPALFDAIPTARRWPIKGDAARPETVHYLKNRGFNITSAPKWAGSVEDGVSFLKGFSKIHIHPDCPNMIEEAKLYSYKRDRAPPYEVLPVLEDAHNHGWDAVRYGLADLIRIKQPMVISPEMMARSRVPTVRQFDGLR